MSLLKTLEQVGSDVIDSPLNPAADAKAAADAALGFSGMSTKWNANAVGRPAIPQIYGNSSLLAGNTSGSPTGPRVACRA